MKYSVVSKNREGEVYSITPPQSREYANHHKDMLEDYMMDGDHFIVPEDELDQYKKYYD